MENNFSTSFQNFPSDDCTFNKDFSVLPVFVPTDTLDHIKNADGDAIAEMSSSKGLQMVPFVHDIQVSSGGGPDVIFLRALC